MNPRLLSALALGLLASSASAQDKLDLADPKQKTSYAFGMDVIATLKQNEVDVDTKALAAGIADMLAGKAALTTAEKQEAMDQLSKNMMLKAEAERKIIGQKNLKDGRDFLEAKARETGVQSMEVTAPDGVKTKLEYEILKTGSGSSPKTTDVVEVHYEGSLINGTVFDSSVKRGTPATFPMDHIVPGWAIALQKMKAGDKWRLFMPANLGYGESGPPQIPPNSALIFDLELISFYPPVKFSGAAGSSSLEPVKK